MTVVSFKKGNLTLIVESEQGLADCGSVGKQELTIKKMKVSGDTKQDSEIASCSLK